MQTTERKLDFITNITLIILFFGIAYGAYLGSYAFFIPDDARYAEISREMARSGDYLTPRLDGLKYFEKPPLFYWLEAMAIEIGGNTLWIGRSVNALFALLGCVVIYIMGRAYSAQSLRESRLTGWLAAGVLGSSLLYIILARYVTLDMTLTFCLSASLFSFLRAYLLPIGLEKRMWCYVAYSAAALAVLAKGLIGLVLPVGVMGAWILLRWDWQSLRNFYLPTGLLLFLAIALPWHVLMQMEHPEFFNYYIIEHHFSRYATLSAQRYEPWWFFIPITLVGFLPWVVFLPQTLKSYLRQGWHAWRSQPVTSFLLVWIVVIFLFFSLSNSKLVPYILPIFPPLALLVAYFFIQCYQLKKPPLTALWVLASIAMLLVIVAWTTTWWFPEKLLKYAGMIPYIRGVALFYLFSIGLCGYFWRKQQLLMGMGILVASTLLSLNVAMINVEPYVNSKSTKIFADYLQPILTDQDIIIAYNTFYYDLPYYLDRLILLTSHGGELNFGAQHEPDNPQLITKTQVWELWNSPQRVFIVTKPDNYAKFQQEQHNVWLLAETSRAVLLSNQKDKTSPSQGQ